jgi:hypothetical protein
MLISYALPVLLVALLTGCGAAAKIIISKSQSEVTDVFREVAAGEVIPAGYAEIVIRAEIKTHLEGYYIGESGGSVHGKGSYPFLVNIDGQAARWEAPGARDTRPAYDRDGKTSRDPEAGDGMKYLLERKLRLAAGHHNVFLGLPQENYCVEAGITVQSGETTVMEYKPVYRYKTLPTRIPSFLRGLSHYELSVNGKKYPL